MGPVRSVNEDLDRALRRTPKPEGARVLTLSISKKVIKRPGEK